MDRILFFTYFAATELSADDPCDEVLDCAKSASDPCGEGEYCANDLFDEEGLECANDTWELDVVFSDDTFDEVLDSADLDTGEVLEDIPVVGVCRDELSRKLDRPRKLKVEFFGQAETVPSSRDDGHVSSSLDAGGLVIQAIQRANEGIDYQREGGSCSRGSNQALDRPEYDEYAGILLPKDLVRQAKKDELEFVRSKRVWRVVPRSHAGHRRIIGTRW